MISVDLMIYCILVGGFYLLVLSAVLELVGRKLKIAKGLPAELLEPFGWSWFALSYVMELLFFVIVPTFVYSFFYLIVPLSGIRAGMAAALFAFTLGMIPALMGLSIRVKLPMLYLLYLLLELLLKLSGSMIIIGYLYAL